MKKLISITIAIVLALSQTTMASAYVQDVIYGEPAAGQSPVVQGTALVAEKDFTNVTPTALLTVAIKNVADDTTAGQIGWASVNLGDGWSVADQYLEVTYDANQIGWGVQIYSDNMSVDADPKFTGDPTTNTADQPSGLIGEASTDIALPMTLLVSLNTVPAGAVQMPVEQEGYGYFVSGIDVDQNPNTGYSTYGADITWFWLKDKANTRGDDVNNNGVLDLEGSFGDPGYEIVPDFATDGDDYATIVNTEGASSGLLTSDGQGNIIMQRDVDAASPLIVYMAANFEKAQEIQKFRTNTLSIELYHQ